VYVATESALGWSAVRIARQLGIPVVSGFHTNFHVYARHHRAGCLGPLVLRYLRRFHNRTSGTLVPTADLRAQLQRLGFENLRLLGRGVDAELFAPARRSAALRTTWGARDEDLVALSVGRVAPEKNLPLAIAAYRAMRQASPATRLVVVGDGPLRSALETAHPDALFAGARTGEDLAAHYASADVFLFPSETETFGNVTLEALASGLAVLAYDYAAAHLYVRSGESGVLAPLGDAPAFIDAAVDLARAPHQVAAMRPRARAQALAASWPSIVARFEAVLAGADPASRPPRRATHRPARPTLWPRTRDQRRFTGALP
jgi:glycosyltransferase involved in cell wall biosynthesis